MTTYSQLVDKIILETKRPDLASEIQSYVNQTIRELHNRPDTNATLLFPDNRKEIQLTASTESGFTWELPNPQCWQTLELVRYDSVWDEDGPIYPKVTHPSRALKDLKYYAYRAGGYYSFHGYGGIGSIINVSYFEFPRALKYRQAAAREATWDEDSGWTYLAGITTDEQKAAAREKGTNWILERWADVVLEGLRAKVYKRVNDEARARTSYSLYAQLRQGMATISTDQ